MPTLVLNDVPDALYRRIAESAASHRRSLTQEAIAALQSALDAPADRPPRPSVADSLAWLQAEVWSLPRLDRRRDDAVLGYNADGHFD